MMKKLLFTFLFILFVSNLFGQKVIKMQRDESGTFNIVCHVNGAKMKMIFDTGASGVSLSRMMAEYLLDNDFLSEEDFIGKGSAQIADGSIVPVYIVNIKDLEIDGLHLKNVEASIDSNLRAPLLLGQSAIQKLGSITLDGDLLIVNSVSEDVPTRIKDLRDAYNDAFQRQEHEQMLEIAQQLKQYSESDTILYLEAFAYELLGEDDKTIKLNIEWLRKTANQKPGNLTYLAYQTLGKLYKKQENYREAIYNYKQMIPLVKEYRTYPDDYSDLFFNLGLCYAQCNDYASALPAFQEALRYELEVNNVSIEMLEKAPISNNNLGVYLFDCAASLEELNNTKESRRYYSLAASCGNKPSIDYCNKHKIKFKVPKLIMPGQNKKEDAKIIAKLKKEIHNLNQNKQGQEMLSKISELEKYAPHNDSILILKFEAYAHLKNYPNAIKFAQEWLSGQDESIPTADLFTTYKAIGFFYSNPPNPDFVKANIYFKKAESLLEKFAKDLHDYSITYFQIGRGFYMLDQYNSAIIYFKKALQYELDFQKLEFEKLKSEAYDQTLLGQILYGYGFSLNELGNKEDANMLMIMGANCGHSAATEYCKKNNLKFYTPKL